MLKRLMILITLTSLFLSCGKRSEIKNSVHAQSLTSIKDTATFVIPLTEEEIDSFDSPVKNLGGIIGGISRIFMNFAASIGLNNKISLSLTQQVPKFPAEYLKHIKLKRVFFYIESTEKKKKKVNFNFLERVAIKVDSHTVENTENWLPNISTTIFQNRKQSSLGRLFEKRTGPDTTDYFKDEALLLKYSKNTEKQEFEDLSLGKTYIIKTNHPKETREYFENHPKMRDFFKRIHYINRDVLVELIKDPVVEESFNVVLASEKMEVQKLGVEFKNVCNDGHSCKNFRMADINLIPMLQRSNAIKLDCYFEVSEVPESFQLKGFVEFEIKFNKEMIKI